jgi:DUF4097 and DUF4098 domain-containing protein YvlB
MKTFTYEDIHSISIETISGNIRICPGTEGHLTVELINDLEEPELLDPELEAEDGELSIEENFTGRHVRGETHWTVYLPKSANLRLVECNSASGEISLEEFKADRVETESASGQTWVHSVQAKGVRLSTASGRITLEDCEARVIEVESASGRITTDSVRAEELELSTASGKIVVRECEGDLVKANSASGKISVRSANAEELELSNASGKIIVEGGAIDESGEMSSASGDVELYLSGLPLGRLKASSASGDVFLKVPQFGKSFSMTLMKRADKGRVKCPFEYTETETIRYHKHDDYLTDVHLVEHGEGGPEITLRTWSGAVEIETDTKGR